jgi:electron transport complex protein RnfG
MPMASRATLIGGALLGLFGVLGSTLVALTYQGTAARIAENERQVLLEQIGTLLPPSRIDNDILADTRQVQAPEALGAPDTTVYTGRRAGRVVAVVLSPVVAPDGYNGPIRLIVGINADGSLAGVRVLSQQETPGLGDQIDIRKSDWITHFTGRSLGNPPLRRWKVKKDGGVFDQFTGATITPRAVVKAVKKSLQWMVAHHAELFGTTAQETTP